jgi:hypothetical protein
VATTDQRPAASQPTAPMSAPKPAASSGQTAAAKPTASPAPSGSAASTAAQKPSASSGQASPAATGAARATGSPPAVVATSAAVLPAVVAPTAPTQSAQAAASPAPAGAPRHAAPADALGVAASAGSAAAVTTGPDAEAAALCGQGAILSTRAAQAAGRQATIAIARVEASYQPNVRGQPTFLNDALYPNHVFTAVIWGGDRRQFDPTPTSWQGKALCVTGAVELYQQRPQITVNSPNQLRAAR